MYTGAMQINTDFPSVSIALDGDTVVYRVAITTAPAAYDGFGTISLVETYDGEGKEARIVLIRDEHFVWQTMRYSSGCHTASPFDKEGVVEWLWKRISSGTAQVGQG